MPLYEYKCKSCGKVFEVIEKFSDEPMKTHRECGGEVERLLSAPAFHLKGTGWYVTDYGKGNSRASKSDESKKEKSDSKAEKPESPSAGSDAKTAPPTAESKPSPAA